MWSSSVMGPSMAIFIEGAVCCHCTPTAASPYMPHGPLSLPYRTFVFNKLLPQPSELLLVTLPRPMGVVFEYDQQKKRAVVADVMEGSAAEQRQKVAGIN